MLRLSRLLRASFVALIGTTVIAAPAFANYQVKTTNEVHLAYTETFACPFDIRVHLDGFFKSVGYYDNSGFRYKTINTPREAAGPSRSPTPRTAPLSPSGARRSLK